MNLSWKQRISTSLLLAGVIAMPVFAGYKPSEGKNDQDRFYGAALFEMYKGDYFEALTQLQRLRASGLPYDARALHLLEGNIQLDYSMNGYAKRRFEKVQSQNVAMNKRDELWLELADNYYQRGDDMTAVSSLSNVSQTLHKDKRNQYYSLSLLLPFDWDAAQLEELVGASGDSTIWHIYVLNNAAVKSYQQGDLEKAKSYIERATTAIGEPTKFDDAERNNLRNHIKLMRAYINYHNGTSLEETVEDFRDISLESNASKKALLGLGWAAYKDNQLPLALGAWRYLSQASIVDAPVQEALVNIPLVYRQLGARQRALDAFKEAEVRLLAAKDSLEQVREDLDFDRLVGKFLKKKTNKIQSLSLVNQDKKWLSRKDISPYLISLMASNKIHSQIDALNELFALQKTSDDMLDKMNLSRQHGVLGIEQGKTQQLVEIESALLKVKEYQVVREGLDGQMQQALLRQSESANDLTTEQLEQLKTWPLTDANKLHALAVAEQNQLIDAMKTANVNAAFSEAVVEQFALHEKQVAVDAEIAFINQQIKAMEEKSNEPIVDKAVVSEKSLKSYENQIYDKQEEIAKLRTTLLDNLNESIHAAINKQQAQIDNFLSQIRLHVVILHDSGFTREGGQ